MKKFLIYLIVLCSFFLFSNKANAEYVNLCNTTYDCSEENINNIVDGALKELSEGYNGYRYFIFQIKPEDGCDENGNYCSKFDADLALFQEYDELTFFEGYNNNFLMYPKTLYHDTTAKDLLNNKMFTYDRSKHYVKTGNYSIKFFPNYYYLDEYYFYTNIPTLKQYNNVNFNTKYNNINVTFHINGGVIKQKNVLHYDGTYITSKDEFYTKDYSIYLLNNSLKAYLLNQEQYKENMVFSGYYYDSKFTKKFNIDDIPQNDIDLYAKFDFDNVEDFLENNEFDEYDFNTNYRYAIISSGSNIGDVYLGLNIFKTNLELYNYNKINNRYDNGAAFCLSPYYSKKGIYYYKLDFEISDNYKVLILDRDQLEENYHFYLTKNCHITYTNLLDDVVIYDEKDEEIHTDLEPSYSYSQNSQTEMQNGNNLISKLKDYFQYFSSNVIDIFTRIWKNLYSSKIISYISLLITGTLIILIINTANRK